MVSDSAFKWFLRRIFFFKAWYLLFLGRNYFFLGPNKKLRIQRKALELSGSVLSALGQYSTQRPVPPVR